MFGRTLTYAAIGQYCQNCAHSHRNLWISIPSLSPREVLLWCTKGPLTVQTFASNGSGWIQSTSRRTPQRCVTHRLPRLPLPMKPADFPSRGCGVETVEELRYRPPPWYLPGSSPACLGTDAWRRFAEIHRNASRFRPSQFRRIVPPSCTITSLITSSAI